MTKRFAIALLAAFGLAAQAPASAGTAKPKAAKTTAAVKKAPGVPAPVMVIPKDALSKSDGTYTWTDKQGKRWLFVKTPFGVMKNPAIAGPEQNAPLTGVKTFDEGDKVRFEMASPFGVIRREKNKADLTSEERTLFDSQHPAKTEQQD